MDDVLIPIVVVGILFIGLPWLIFHYITKWKTAATLTVGRREAARRAARRRAPARRPAVHDRADHDRRESRTGASSACPAATTASACSRTESEHGLRPLSRAQSARTAAAYRAAYLSRAAGEPHPLLSRQAQRQGHGRLRRHRRLYRLRRQPGPHLLPRRDVHERRLDPALLFHRRAGSRRPSRASSNMATARKSSSGRASAPRRPAPRATSARASRTSTAGWPTSKAM